MSDTRPAFVSTRVLADVLGIHVRTAWWWCRTGRIPATRVNPQLHYTDSRPRKSNRGYYRIAVVDIEALLTAAYSGTEVPRAIRLKLRRLARELEPGTVSPTTMPNPRGGGSSEGGEDKG